MILGTNGFVELRKSIEIARNEGSDQCYLVNGEGEKRLSFGGKVGYLFFGQLILDCLHRTETAMTQRHAFKAAELCLKARRKARRTT